LLKNSTEKEIIQALGQKFRQTSPGKVVFSSINYFNNKRVVAFFQPDKTSRQYIKVLLSKGLDALKEKAEPQYNSYQFDAEKFEPHLTIAEKIPRREFSQVKKVLDQFRQTVSFAVGSVHLLRQTPESNQWKRLKELKF